MYTVGGRHEIKYCTTDLLQFIKITRRSFLVRATPMANYAVSTVTVDGVLLKEFTTVAMWGTTGDALIGRKNS